MQVVAKSAGVTMVTAGDIDDAVDYQRGVSTTSHEKKSNVRFIVSDKAFQGTLHTLIDGTVSLFGSTTVVAEQSCQQYASLCQAVCATMRQAVAEDIIIFVSACTDHIFRNEREAAHAFERLTQYFIAELGQASAEAPVIKQAYDNVGQSSHEGL